jgi:hypothetical protein
VVSLQQAVRFDGSAGDGATGGTMEVLTLAIACHEGSPPADDIFFHAALAATGI